MKVLHITTSDSGGAGLCVLRIHKSLLELGVDSKVLVAKKRSDLPTVFQAEESGLNTYVPPKNSIIMKFEKVMRRRGQFLNKLEQYQRSVACLEGKALYSFPLSKYDLSIHPLVEEADVVHLHWVANFLDYPTFFSKVEKPIVWTFHDENIAFGGFHYKKERDKYYGLCKNTEDDLVSVKREALSSTRSSITIVALSEMMKTFCERTPVVSSFPIEIIHNSVDYKKFSPITKRLAKQVFCISDDQIVFGFCCVDLSEKRKGLEELIRVLERLNESYKVILMCAGEGKIPVQTNLSIIKTGSIENERIMSLFFSALDYYVMPSFQEAFAQTPLEAMACGVPVVAFPCSGTKDLINKDNGVVCDDFSVDSLYHGIVKAMETIYDSDEIRLDVINRFSPLVIAQQYGEVYRHMLDNNGGEPKKGML